MAGRGEPNARVPGRVQYPRRKDNLEKLLGMVTEWRRGRPGYEHRVDPDSEWAAQHRELGNTSRA
jgi:hypothetical protein